MEACQSYKPWHDKVSHKTFLKPNAGKYLHYYFMDAVVGLYYLRVPTWCLFRLRFYCNCLGWLVRKLKAKRIERPSRITLSRGLKTGQWRRSSPTPSSPSDCTACSVATPNSAAQSSTP
jgi:hypothetical protein